MKLHATTILTVRHQGNVAMGGDELVVYATPWTRDRPWNSVDP